MLDILVENRWAFALRGSLAIMYGLTALVLTDFVVMAPVIAFAGYALMDGAFALAPAVWAARRGRTSFSLSAEGLVGAATGLLLFLWPQISHLTLSYVIAMWFLLQGAARVMAGADLHRERTGERLLVWCGSASLAFGVVLAEFWGTGFASLVMQNGAFVLFIGVMYALFAQRLEHYAERHIHHTSGHISAAG